MLILSRPMLLCFGDLTRPSLRVSAMRLSPRSLPGWTTAGAVVGFLCVLAVAMLAVYQEVYVGCGTFVMEGWTLGRRCHHLSYAVSMVLRPLFTLGAFVTAVGSLTGLSMGTLVLSFASPPSWSAPCRSSIRITKRSCRRHRQSDVHDPEQGLFLREH